MHRAPLKKRQAKYIIGMLCMQELFQLGWVDLLKHCK